MRSRRPARARVISSFGRSAESKDLRERLETAFALSNQTSWTTDERDPPDASSVHSRSNEVVSERSRELLRSRQLAHDLSNALLGEQSLLSGLIGATVVSDVCEDRRPVRFPMQIFPCLNFLQRESYPLSEREVV